MTMSLARRTALIDFARACDAYIFEDDHNSEFRYNGPPLPCLQGLDNVGRVIYSGTMSKILYPSFFFSSRRRHTRYIGDWSSDVCSSDLVTFASFVVGTYPATDPAYSASVKPG